MNLVKPHSRQLFVNILCVLSLLFMHSLYASTSYQFEHLWPKLDQNWYFSEISRLAVDDQDLVYVDDAASDKVLVFTIHGEFIRTVDGADFPANNSLSSSEGNRYRIKTGNMSVGGFVPDHVEVVDQSGKLIQTWRSYGDLAGQFNVPTGMAVSSTGEVFVTDGNNHRIQVFNQKGEFIREWGQKGSAEGQLLLPVSIAIDKNDQVYVGENGNFRVQVFDTHGHYLRTLAQIIFDPVGIAVSTDDIVYVIEKDIGILVFNAQGNMIRSWGSESINDGKGFSPEAIAISQSGIVYVSDIGSLAEGEGNNRILTFTLAGEFLSTFAVAGTDNNQINDVESIAISPNGELAFTEQEDHRIKIFNAEGEWIENIGSFGHQQGQFRLPAGVAYSALGDLVVVDAGHNRVQMFTRQEENRHKAIILAGGGPSTDTYTNLIWDATVLLSNKANQALRAQGYAKNEIKYLTAGKTQVDIDGNGLFDDLESANLLSLEAAITEWAGDANDVVIYMADHGGPGRFQVNSSEILHTAMLQEWIDNLEQQIPGKITLIIESCKAGSFIGPLAKPGRYLIASSDARQPAIISNKGLNAFSYYLWNEINAGANLKSAFRTARQGMSSQFIQGRAQNAQLDSNGDQQLNQDDYQTLGDFCLGNCLTFAANPPSIIDVTEKKALNGETSSLLTMRINSLEDILQAWVVVTKPDFLHLDSDEPVNDLAKLPLHCNDKLECSVEYSEFDVVGDYQVTFHAQDQSHQVAIPVSTVISQSKGASIPIFKLDSAVYDAVNGIVYVEDVQVANMRYQAELVDLGEGRFGVKTAIELDGPRLQHPNVFDVAAAKLVLLNVKVYERHFKVTLKHLGELIFQIETVEEVF